MNVGTFAGFIQYTDKYWRRGSFIGYVQARQNRYDLFCLWARLGIINLKRQS